MCGKSEIGLRKIGVFLLALSVLLPCSSWADVRLTDQEYDLLMKDLTDARELQKKQSDKIASLESDLTTVRKIQESSDRRIEKLESDLSSAKAQQQESETTIKELRSDLMTVSKSFKTLKREQRKEKVEAFLWGTAAGFCGGFGTGVYMESRK